MDFETIIKERYATKEFDGHILPRDKVDRLLEIIRFAPSSFNIQPWKIKVISDQKNKDELSEVAWHQPQIKSASHVLVFCADSNISALIDSLEEHFGSKGKHDPYVEMMRNFEKKMNHEQKVSWAQRQSYLALANGVNGAKALGFDSCPMEGFSPEGVAKLLNLPSNLTPTALCAIGYAKDKPKPKFRFPKDKVFF